MHLLRRDGLHRKERKMDEEELEVQTNYNLDNLDTLVEEGKIENVSD